MFSVTCTCTCEHIHTLSNVHVYGRSHTGAQSCPPILVYATDELELHAQLQGATELFLDQHASFNTRKHSIKLSMIFSWYRSDFGANDEEIVAWIKQNCSPELRMQFEQFELVTACLVPALEFEPYDWSMNGEWHVWIFVYVNLHSHLFAYACLFLCIYVYLYLSLLCL